jgi:hypothetical protein
MAARVLALPIRIVAGGFATIEQGTAAEIAQSVAILLRTLRDSRLEVPGYGVPDFVGLTAIDLGIIREAIARWEPRALATVEGGAPDLSDEGLRRIIVNIDRR